MEAIYRPAHAKRIGLRYINRFTPQGASCATMSEVFALFRPELTSLLQTDAWSQPTSLVTHSICLTATPRLRYGRRTAVAQTEPFFLLDSTITRKLSSASSGSSNAVTSIIVSSIMPSAGVCASRVWPAFGPAS